MSTPPIPEALAHLPVVAGFAVPYITAARTDNGAFRFGGIDGDKQRQCLMNRLCQVCGLVMREQIAFLVRPFSDAVIMPDWVFAKVVEPGMHPLCLSYSVAACPMLNGTKTHYRSTPLRLGPGIEPPADSARFGAAAERWFEVWVRSYKVEVNASAGRAILHARLNQAPLRVRAIENHPSHPARSATGT